MFALMILHFTRIWIATRGHWWWPLPQTSPSACSVLLLSCTPAPLSAATFASYLNWTLSHCPLCQVTVTGYNLQKNPKVGLEFNIKGCVLLYSDFFKIATLEDTFPNIIQEDKNEHQEFINQIIQGYEWLLWIPNYMWVKRGRKSILKQETAKNYLDIKYSILGNYVHLKF